MSFILTSYLSTIYTFFWDVLYSFWLREETAAPTVEPYVVNTSNRAATAGDVEAQRVLNNVVVSDDVTELSACALSPEANCRAWYAEGEEVAIVMEAFLPSKLAEAMDHYGNISDSSFNRQSMHSAETTITEESDCFSERDSISSSVTSVDDVESEGSSRTGVEEVEKKCEGEVGREYEGKVAADDRGISDESGCEDVFDEMLEYYFSGAMMEDDGNTKQGMKKAQETNARINDKIGTEGIELYVGAQDIANLPEEVATLFRQFSPPPGDAIVLEAPDPFEVEEPSELSYLLDDESQTSSFDFDISRPFRPVRGPEEDLSGLFDFMEECNFVLPELLDDVFLKGFDVPDDVASSTPRLSDSAIMVLPVGQDVLAPRIVVQSPSSEVFPPCPARPRRDRENDWTEVLEFMDERDSEFPVLFVVDEGCEVECDCSFGFMHGHGLSVAHGIRTNWNLGALCPRIVVHGPSAHVLSVFPVLPCEEFGEDVCDGSQGLLVGAASTPPTHQTDKLEINPVHEIDFFQKTNNSNSNRVKFSGSLEDEFDAVFDIIDNFGISIEEGLVFFERASEWLAERARDEAKRVLSRCKEDEERDVGTHDLLLESDLPPVDSTLRAEGSLSESLMPSAVRDRMVVAPGDYLRVPKRSYRRY